MNVLIVEDDPGIAESVLLCLQLRMTGMVGTIVVEGLKTVEIVKSHKFDIVLLDINLPDIDGFNVLKKIRQFSNIPILIVSVRNSDADIAKGMELGANGYMTKPFKYTELISKVNEIVR